MNTWPCPKCEETFSTPEGYVKHLAMRHGPAYEPTAKQEAIRNPQPLRYDILDPEFLEVMARIADYGAKKYGDFNWHKSRLVDDKSPINHIYKHLKSYRMNEPYDHSELGSEARLHLVAIAFNAMMEFYYASRPKENL